MSSWLILGRVSNLPTVWSNCLAAWLLGGGESWGRLGWVLVGGSLIYVGGMFLNDACDVEFDRAYRPERPIVSGQVTAGSVWLWGCGMLLGGWVCLARLGQVGVVVGLALLVAVVAYDVFHKFTRHAPVLMAACRLLLFVVAGSAGVEGVLGETLWSALALALYVVGLSYVARQESIAGTQTIAPLILMAAPLVLAGFVNPSWTWGRSVVLMPVVLFLAWTLRCLLLLWRGGPTAGARAAVPGLLAGIVWVDVVAVMPSPWPWGAAFVGLFALAMLLQRVVPAS
ncbi:MAG: UbiA family prenyltransferase [Verrucomicrobiales bacterium]|nr:UbiA family prenyltransferase [Verrucomicrobiales bacterium]